MDGIHSNAQISFAASSMFPGFKFSPTDEELISYYLRKKLDGQEESVQVISQLEIWRYEPWDLPAKSVIESENEWFFFSPRGRKYPNGSQSKRATDSGYWKATGKERNVKAGAQVIGTKRTLVFHLGRAPKGERTEWMMHEYCALDKSQDSLVVCRLRRNTEFRSNDASNQGSCSQRNVVTSHDSSVASDGALDQGTPMSDAALDQRSDCKQEKEAGSSCNDSHSMAQIDSASEPNRKLKTDEEDYFADILRDEIVKLDDSRTTMLQSMPMNAFPELVKNEAESSTSSMLLHKSEQQASEDSAELTRSQPPPVQGTAHRRIRLRKFEPCRSAEGDKKLIQKSNNVYSPSIEQPSKTSFSVRTAMFFVLLFVSTLLILVSLFLPLWGRLEGYSSGINLVNVNRSPCYEQ